MAEHSGSATAASTLAALPRLSGVSSRQVEPPGQPGSPASETPLEGAEADPSELLEQSTSPPRPRDAVERAHKVPHRRRNRRDFLRLDLAESSEPASPRVLEALQSPHPEQLSRYPDVWPLKDTLAALHGVSTGNISVTAGADEAIRWTFNAFLEPGARVVVPRPTFGAFLAAAEAGGAFVERVDHGEDLELSVEDFERALSPRTPRLACLANPNAPTGTAVDSEDILRLAASSPSTLFLVNETFVAFHGRSLLDDEGGARLPSNLLVLRSLSKDYGLAGLRVGYLVGAPEVIAAIDLARPSCTVSAPSLVAAEAALSDGVAMKRRVEAVRVALEGLARRLEQRGVEVRRTRTSFLLVKLSSPIQPWAAAFAAHKILVGTAGHAGPMAPYVRVTVNSEEEASRFLDVLDVILRMGVAGAARVRGVPGKWDELDREGMA